MGGEGGKETVLDADDGTFASSHWLRLERWESGRTREESNNTIDIDRGKELRGMIVVEEKGMWYWVRGGRRRKLRNGDMKAVITVGNFFSENNHLSAKSISLNRLQERL